MIDQNELQFVDIRKIFHDKNPRLAKMLPGFVYRYIERIVHQDEINDILKLHGHKTGIEFTRSCMDYFNVSVITRGLEELPLKGRYLLVSNHPLGGFDGIIEMTIISETLGDVRVLVNDILMNIKNIKPLFLPINKHGSNSKDAAIAIDEAFASDIPMLTFPAGLCSRKIKGKVVDLEWKKNFINKAVTFKRDIVPIYFEGLNSNFFYNLSTFRKKIGITANIEMFYLSDELFKHRNKTFTVTFGSPISYQIFDKRFSQSDWAEKIKEHVYQLGSGNKKFSFS